MQIEIDEALKRAFKNGGGSAAVAKKIGVTHQAVGQWKRCPPLRVLAVEAATGVSRHDLRPDLYPRAEPVVREHAGVAA